MTAQDLESYLVQWTSDCSRRGLSPRTIDQRLNFGRKLIWFLITNNLDLDVTSIQRFFDYLRMPVPEGEGRWGCDRRIAALPLTNRTILNFQVILSTWFDFCTREGLLRQNPIKNIGKIKPNFKQIQPFTREQVIALLSATETGCYPRRDFALVLVLLDTGLRASEFCALSMADYDARSKALTVVHGKGGKRRVVFLGAQAADALNKYLRIQPREPDEPLFLSEARKRLTVSGLQQIVYRLEEAAKLTGVRCSPHTFRHTFAIEFLRNGGGEFALMQMLGHSSLAMTRRYCAVAESDTQRIMRTASPVDNLVNRKRR